MNAILLNEFLKEHRRVGELTSAMAQQRKDFEAAIAQQQKGLEAIVAQQSQEFHEPIAQQENKIRAMIATVEKQAVQIQKVGAQVEMSKAPLQLTAAGNL